MRLSLTSWILILLIVLIFIGVFAHADNGMADCLKTQSQGTCQHELN